MRPEAATQYIASFANRFGRPHLYFACHAALPLAVTPDLLYSLWANFQRDCHDRSLNIPWVAVANLLLSSLFKEVGYELYEMDDAVRSQLIAILKEDKTLGQKRIIELSHFLKKYVRQQLYSEDIDMQDFAKAQHWTALAYIKPIQAARELALTFQKQFPEIPSAAERLDKIELVRLAAIVETLAEPLSEKNCQPLLVYARAMASFARDDLEAAAEQFATIAEFGKIEVVDLELPIPEAAQAKLANFRKPVGAYLSLGRKWLQRRWIVILVLCALLLLCLLKIGYAIVISLVVMPLAFLNAILPLAFNLTNIFFKFINKNKSIKGSIRRAGLTSNKLVGTDLSRAETGLQRRWATLALSPLSPLLLLAVLRQELLALIVCITMIWVVPKIAFINWAKFSKNS